MRPALPCAFPTVPHPRCPPLPPCAPAQPYCALHPPRPVCPTPTACSTPTLCRTPPYCVLTPPRPHRVLHAALCISLPRCPQIPSACFPLPRTPSPTVHQTPEDSFVRILSPKAAPQGCQNRDPVTLSRKVGDLPGHLVGLSSEPELPGAVAGPPWGGCRHYENRRENGRGVWTRDQASPVERFAVRGEGTGTAQRQWGPQMLVS